MVRLSRGRKERVRRKKKENEGVGTKEERKKTQGKSEKKSRKKQNGGVGANN